MNFTHIAGHLGADPEVRFTSSGKKVTTLRVATRARRSQNNEETIWWSVSIWGDQFDKMIAYFKKGSPIIVFGEMHKPRLFNDRDGKPQVAMEITASHIEFSPFGRPGTTPEGTATPGAGASAAPSNPYMTTGGSATVQPQYQHQSTSLGGGDTIDDEVPF